MIYKVLQQLRVTQKHLLLSHRDKHTIVTEQLYKLSSSVNQTSRKVSTSNRNTPNMALQDQTLKHLATHYQENGYAVLQNFLTNEEVLKLRDETYKLIKESQKRDNKLQIFGNEFNCKSRFFLDSSDKICYFFEKSAVNLETLELLVPEDKSLAKIAHALHSLNPTFNRVTTSDKVKDVFKALDFSEPAVVQSMVIFKNPKLGGAYTAHQDASFLYTEPPNHLVGVWIALDDATIENGCLEFIAGSHKWPVARRLVRTGKTEDGDNLLDWDAPVRNDDEKQFVKVPVKKGDLVLIHGQVVHRSAENRSENSRWAYTFHAYDKGKSRYSDQNWLQMNVNDTFISLYRNGQ